MRDPTTTGDEAISEPLSDTADGELAEVAAIGPVERKLRADAERNRQRVLAAAAAVFAERGLEVSLDEVAHAAGVGVGTVYRRFPNKEALVDALFDDKVEHMLVLAGEAAAFDDAWEGFVYFVERALDWQVRNRGLRDVLLGSEFGCAAVARTRTAITPILTTIIERAQSSGKLRPDVVVNDVPMLVTMLGAVADYVGPSDPELWRRYMVLILDGLSADRAAWTPLDNPPSEGVVDAAMKRCR